MYSKENIFSKFKIIDSHLHIGTVAKFDMSEKMCLSAMNKYNICKGLVSNIEAIEYDHLGNKAPVKSQLDANETVRKMGEAHDNVKGLFWIKPSEGFTNEVREYIIENQDIFIGLKVHPYHSKLPVTDPLYKCFFDFAADIGLPVVIHTARDEYSKSDFVYEVAKQYPTINFVMVHIDLASDHKIGAGFIKELPNLYGDTTWITSGESLEMIVNLCGSDKILFGTDSPIDGVDTYKSYQELLLHMDSNMQQSDIENILYKNSLRIFHKLV